MSADLIDEIMRTTGIQRRSLLEKDLLMHRILRRLTADPQFRDSYLFKGGTCLTKCHLGYYRFSEDIDFTYRDQGEYEGLSMKEIRRLLSATIDRLAALFENLAEAENLDFRPDKTDRRYIELGGSNRFCTLKLWYGSTAGARSFVKAQFNFVERLCYEPLRVRAGNVMGESGRGVAALYPEAAQYLEPLELWSYDPREIMCEKVRAILTRRGVKARDYIDLYMLKEKRGLKIEDEIDCISNKTIYMLAHYERFRRNLEDKKSLLRAGSLFEWGGEQALLLVTIDSPRFYQFVESLESTLRKIIASTT